MGLNIPRVDGFDLIRILSNQYDSGALRYCVVTGLTQDEIKKRGHLPADCPVSGGEWRRLTKPINFSKVREYTYADVSARRLTVGPNGTHTKEYECKAPSPY